MAFWEYFTIKTQARFTMSRCLHQLIFFIWLWEQHHLTCARNFGFHEIMQMAVNMLYRGNGKGKGASVSSDLGLIASHSDGF